MIDLFSHGQGNKPQAIPRRVDIAAGRVIRQEGLPPSTDSNDALRDSMRRKFAASLALIVLIVAMLVSLSGCAATPKVQPSIAIESVRITAAGHYIDLRYRVLDSERANASLGPGIKPVLIDEATGTVMEVPMTAKLGALRQTRGVQRPDRTYFVLFANTAGLTSGSRVTAEIGDMSFERLTIE